MTSKNQIENVLKYLGNHQNNYVIIGGIASWLNLSRLEVEPRPTKDFDIVLCLEIENNNFNKDIVNFIKDGGYKHSFTNKKKCCYRFEEPKIIGYPKIIEFFAPEDQTPKVINQYLKKINIKYEDDELSAIILDKSIYEFIKNNKTIIDGLSVATMQALIALKAYAYYKNKELYNAKKIKSKNDYKKHKSDIIRLLANIPGNINKIELPEILKDSILKFKEVVKSSTNIIKGLRYNNVVPNDLLKKYNALFK